MIWFFAAGACAGMVQLGGVFGNVVWGYISDCTLTLVRDML